MIENFIKKHWLVSLYLALYFIAINLLVLNRFWQYEAFYYDHGIYDSALWQVAHFQIPLIDHLERFPIRQWGDHFTPTMYLLTPLYFFTKSYEAILVVQNIIVTGAALVVFLIASHKIPNRLMAFAILFGFTLFIGLQNFLISNFHADGLAILTLALTFFAVERKKWIWFWAFLILTLGAKQNFSAIGVGIGIYLILTKINIKSGLLVIFFSILYFFAATKVFIPIIGARPYWYDTSFYGPVDMARNLFQPPIKVETMISSFATFGFLPLFAFTFLPTIFQDFFTRFVLNSGSARFDLGLHYNATLAVILAYGAILGVSWLLKYKFYKKIINLHAILIIFIVLFLHQFKFHGPLGLVINKDFYRHTQDFKFLKTFTQKIPASGLVMTQNNIAPQLTHTHKVMLLRKNYYEWMPDIIAIDTRSGQNPTDYWPLTPAGFESLQKRLAKDKNYILLPNSTEQQLIYRLRSKAS